MVGEGEGRGGGLLIRGGVEDACKDPRGDSLLQTSLRASSECAFGALQWVGLGESPVCAWEGGVLQGGRLG